MLKPLAGTGTIVFRQCVAVLLNWTEMPSNWLCGVFLFEHIGDLTCRSGVLVVLGRARMPVGLLTMMLLLPLFTWHLVMIVNRVVVGVVMVRVNR